MYCVDCRGVRGRRRHIAYIDGKWLEYDERAEYLEQLKEERDLLAGMLDTGHAMSYDIDRLEHVLDEIETVGRIHRGERDVLFFGMEYFSEDGNPGNAENLIPEGTNVLNAAYFHKQLTDMLDEVTKGNARRHIAWACPRRHAKTAWLSNIYLVHQIVYRLKRYIVLFSETTDSAGDFITWGRYQLKLNERLREDFGELLHVQPSQNELDNKYGFITTNRSKVEAKGLGTQTRGLRHGDTRPELLILDDLESDESTNTPELIEKSKTWFREDMLPALSRDGMVVYLGTILCHGSLLHYVTEERRDFDSRKFAAVETFADNEKLWDEWRKIYRSDSKSSADEADAFFEDNKEAMLEGTSILWPGYFEYYELIKIQENDGTKAFSQEYQNEPTDEERQIFKPEYFHWFDEEDLVGKNIEYYAGIDIAMGKTAGDYTVITTIAKNKDTGVCYVVDIYMERCHPNVLIEKATELTLKYQYERIGIEAQFAQEFIADKLAEELRKHGYPSHTRIKHIRQRTRKSLRIEALLPDVQNGKLRFHRRYKNSREMSQYDMYPMHEHDDVPDSNSMAFSTAVEDSVIVRTINKRTR